MQTFVVPTHELEEVLDFSLIPNFNPRHHHCFPVVAIFDQHVECRTVLAIEPGKRSILLPKSIGILYTTDPTPPAPNPAAPVTLSAWEAALN